MDRPRGHTSSPTGWDRWLSSPWDQLANSGRVWSVLAFAIGAVLAPRVGDVRRIAVAGALAEIGLVVGYYGYAELGREGMGASCSPSSGW